MKSDVIGRDDILVALASAIFREGALARIDRLFAQIGDSRKKPSWVRLAMLRGINGVARKQLPARPENIADWGQIADPAVKAAATKLASLLKWPGNGTPAPVPLTATQQQRFEIGRREYSLCATCHMTTGLGVNGLAPSLVDSARALGPPEIAVRIVLHGKHEWPYSPMPAFANLDDDQIASILTYIRREWGHTASAVEPALVARTRRETRKEEGPLTKQELDRMSPP
jgi:mono/diheme cytochrome c family protein